ncbi:hypothetical protein V1523DRAFT_419468 [Lipomyces doorenjongii]
MQVRVQVSLLPLLPPLRLHTVMFLNSSLALRPPLSYQPSIRIFIICWRWGTPLVLAVRAGNVRTHPGVETLLIMTVTA